MLNQEDLLFKQQNILEDLGQFIGTEEYYKFNLFSNLVLTDGTKYLSEVMGCYWLFDIVASVQNKPRIAENKSFIVWRLVKDKVGRGCVVRAYADYNAEENAEAEQFNKENLLYSQKIPFTDFKLNEFEFYQCESVLMLKSEY